MKQEKITLTIGDATIKLPAATVAQLALVSVLGQITPPPAQTRIPPQPTAAPEIGQPWPGQGGINGGFVPALGEVPAHYLIFADSDVGEHEWGGRNTESKATSRHDGKANTDILVAEGGHPAAEAARAYRADGHADFDLPAASQLYQAWVHGLITEGVYWSSSQRSAYYAFGMYFDGGSQSNNDKFYELRVRPVRRFFI
ncbi:DUF1566 domain-containing protein [Pseudomonas sp. B21-036]|uniref:DUF1566 domain-containing protein n=1 Tax=unclassified Pseudomonas TaxID=196821 RepID=UPI0021604F54|nr:DUF1566 domain-containing protein [Pseudomonas sp. B21-036]UVL48955.1 DUF1566 domain-containing protein [Pseudomonas sp. B21-036]